MRKIIVANIVSLDGYYEGPTNGVMDLPMDEAFNTYNRERLEAADTVLLGATSYQGFSGYWPSIADHPEVPPDDPMAPAYDETNRAISRAWRDKPIVVVSDSFAVPADGPWASHTTVVGRGEAAAWRDSGEGECLVFGSRTMWNGLLAAGLVDELHLMVGATVLGGGTRLFDEPVSLTLAGTRRFDGSDNVLLVYRP